MVLINKLLTNCPICFVDILTILNNVLLNILFYIIYFFILYNILRKKIIHKKYLKVLKILSSFEVEVCEGVGEGCLGQVYYK